MLESKLTEAASKKETLKARAMSAQASKDMNEWLAGQVRLVLDNLLYGWLTVACDPSSSGLLGQVRLVAEVKDA